jgi:hypothetical protein
VAKRTGLLRAVAGALAAPGQLAPVYNTEVPDGADVIWQPFEGFQQAALAANADEVFIGGAKGPGKTDILTVKPLKWAHKPMAANLFLRQTYKELERPLDRAHQIYSRFPVSKRPAWNGEKQRFTWPSGAFTRYGHCRTASDVSSYQGGNWSQILYDEAGNQPDERVIELLISELRCPDPSIRRQFVGSGNPGFAGHPVMKRRYVVPCGMLGENIAWTRAVLPTGDVRWWSRQFVPGRVTDNPIYANDPTYMMQLMLLSDRMQRCLLYGDWDAATGVALDELEPSVHLVKPFECPAHWPFISGFDWGYAHWSVFMWGRIDDDGRIWVCDTIKKRLMRDWDLAGAMKESAPVQALRNVQSGHDCWHERRDRGENAPQTAEYFLGQHIHLVKANIDRAMGYANLLQYFAWRPTAYLPQRQPMVQFFDTPGNRWLVEDHLPSLVMDPDDPRDVLKVETDGESGRGGDDGYDCLVAGTPILTARGDVPIEQVTPYDLVMTRQGWRQVLSAWKTTDNAPVYRVTTSDGRTITGTANHPVYVDGRGFVPLDSLRYGDRLNTWHTQNPSCSTGSPSGDIPTQDTVAIAAISGRTLGTERPALASCIKKSGKPRTVRSLGGIISTIATAIRSTMPRITSYAWIRKPTAPNTAIASGQWRRLECASIWPPSECSRPLHHDRASFARPLAGASRSSSLSMSPSSERAVSAGLTSLTDHYREAGSFAEFGANSRLDAHPASTTYPATVQRAASAFASTATQKSCTAPASAAVVRVVGVERVGSAAVYNFQVSDPAASEYYAAGILVHNCLRYMLASRVMKAQSGSSNRIVSAWDPDVLRKEAEKFRRPQTAPVVGRLARLKEGVFLGG